MILLITAIAIIAFGFGALAGLYVGLVIGDRHW